MPDRSISVHIKAVVTDFQRAMGEATGSLKGFNQQSKRTAEDYSQAMTSVGLAASAAGLAIAAGLGAGVKAAIDWESAFAGVIKTVDATEAELDVLERGLRDLALEIPVSAIELAGIAEAAGQLGIETDNILKFTETMAALGVATNLTSEEAATMFARFANITQLPQQQIENLGSAVVDLGNNLATTEREIIEMGLRIAGAGSQIGLTEAEILGFAGALSSVGIEAQAGGTAISRVFVEIDKSVRAGGDRLALFAEVAGMTAEQFQQAYQEDAAGAIITFVEGLNRISAAGGDVFGVLEALELQDIRVRDALLRAAGAGDLFRESIERSQGAFEENNALSKEAAQRYETVASQLQVFKNTVFELGIGIGEILLPVLVPLLDAAKNMVKWFTDLPEPVKITATALGAVSAALLVISGTALVLAPRIAALAAAYQTLAGSATAAAAATGAANASAVGTGFGLGALRASATFGAGAAVKAVPVAGAAVATGVAIKEGVDLANQIDKGNKELAAQVAKLMLAAEQGDAEAAERLANVRSKFIDEAGWWQKNVAFWTPEFVANRAFLTAAEDLEGFAAAADDAVDAAAPLPITMEGMAAGADRVLRQRIAEGMRDIADASDDAAAMFDRLSRLGGNLWTTLNDIAQAQGNVNEALLQATDPVFNAVSKWEKFLKVQEAVNEEIKDPKGIVIEAEGVVTAREELELLEAQLDMQAALEGLGDNYDEIMGAMMLATGKPRSELEALLDELGMLDGKTFTYTVKQFQVTEQSVVAGPRSPDPRFQPQLRAAGGPVAGGGMYRVGEGNLPELLSTPSGLFMIPGDSGRVFSHMDSKALIDALAKGGGSVTINLYGTGDVRKDMGTVVSMAGLIGRVEATRR